MAGYGIGDEVAEWRGLGRIAVMASSRPIAQANNPSLLWTQTRASPTSTHDP